MSNPTLRLAEVKLPLDHTSDAIDLAVRKRLGLGATDALVVRIFRRGFDARKKSDIHFIYTLDIDIEDAVGALARAKRDPQLGARLSVAPDTTYRFVTRARHALPTRPVVIGTGPCGLFAALTLAQMGFKPIVLERGKAVRERTKDTWGFWRKSSLNAASNVQFGEGGAGTFSDGKLWSQVKDPLHHGRKVLQDMVRGGAPEEILYVSKPHVGTFRLVKVVEFLRAEIERLGGEFRFSTQVIDVMLSPTRQLQGLGLSDGSTLDATHAVLAIGHSARDTFEVLHARGVQVQAKAFSVGFRIEHPQSLIDRARFGPFAGNALLGAADYKLVHHASNGRSVYSFCMCPGGTVVAATSEAGRVVTNGMSQYSRNERNANAGLVVGIEPADFDFGPDGEPLGTERGHPLAGMVFQRALETRAFELGGHTYQAPGQRVADFLAERTSTALGAIEPSYKPGVTLCNLQTSLPRYAIEALREAIPAFAKQIAGFDLPDAMLTGVETRTSSPIRIQRFDERVGPGSKASPHPQRFQSVNTPGLYPAGEGAGYAGGIMSAAIDGIKVAEALALHLQEKQIKLPDYVDA